MSIPARNSDDMDCQIFILCKTKNISIAVQQFTPWIAKRSKFSFPPLPRETPRVVTHLYYRLHYRRGAAAGAALQTKKVLMPGHKDFMESFTKTGLVFFEFFVAIAEFIHSTGGIY